MLTKLLRALPQRYRVGSVHAHGRFIILQPMREFMLDKNPDMANPAIKTVNDFDAAIARTARRSLRLMKTGREEFHRRLWILCWLEQHQHERDRAMVCMSPRMLCNH